jgi:hypothetical protein
MARKRGGIAGVWDRNKTWLTPVAEMLGGAVNPLLGAGIGAAIGGLDRPGKSGIGVDPFHAVTGGLQGYGMGKLGQSARTGIQGMLTGGAKVAAKGAPYTGLVGGVGEDVMGSAQAVGPNASTNLSSLLNPATRPLPAYSPSMLSTPTGPLFTGNELDVAKSALSTNPVKMPSMASKMLSFTKDNADVIGGVGRGVLGTMQYQQGAAANRQQAESNAAQQKLAQDKFNYQKEQEALALANRQRLSKLLLPSLQSSLSWLKPSVNP